MPKVVLADTGPLYALADPSDQYHRRAVGEMRELNKEGHVVAIAYPTLAECYTLVLRRLGRAYSGSWLDEVHDAFMLLNPEAGDYGNGSKRMARFADQPVTLFDAVTAVLSSRLEIPVWTYDRHFDLMGVQRWQPAAR